MAGTFEDRLVTGPRLAGATTIEQANTVSGQFLPRFNRRFQVPLQYPEPAFRPLDPALCLDQILCFKHRRRVAKDNTVRFQLHTLQLLPGPERPSYAGAAVEVLEGLDDRLSVRHAGRILAAQQAPPQSRIPPQRPRAFRKCSGPALRCGRLGRTLDRDPQTTAITVRGRQGSKYDH